MPRKRLPSRIIPLPRQFERYADDVAKTPRGAQPHSPTDAALASFSNSTGQPSSFVNAWARRTYRDTEHWALHDRFAGNINRPWYDN